MTPSKIESNKPTAMLPGDRLDEARVSQMKIKELLSINILSKEKRVSLTNYVSGIMDHLEAMVQVCTSTSSPKPLEKVFQSLQSLSTDVEEIKAKLEQNWTYANVTARPRTTRQSHAVVVSSEDTERNSDDLDQLIKKHVDVRSLGIGVSGMRKTNNDKIIFKMASLEDKNKFKAELNKGLQGKIKITDGKQLNPLVIIKGLIKGASDDDLLMSLENQNKGCDLDTQNLKIKYKKNNRNKLLCNVVLEASPKNWRSLVDAGRVNVGYQRLVVEDQSPLMQCYQCLGFGHTQRFCKEKQACIHCGECHKYDICPNKDNEPTCSNCSGGARNHRSTNPDCPLWKLMDERFRERVDYVGHC